MQKSIFINTVFPKQYGSVQILKETEMITKLRVGQINFFNVTLFMNGPKHIYYSYPTLAFSPLRGPYRKIVSTKPKLSKALGFNLTQAYPLRNNAKLF